MTTYAIILLFLTIGKMLQHWADLPENLPKRLNSFVINIAFPAIILLKIPSLTVDTRLFFPIAMPWIGLLFTSAVVLFLCRTLKWSREVEINLLILTALGNTGFLGYPMVKAFFAEAMLPYALVYDQMGTFLGLSTYGVILTALYAGGEGVSPLRIVRKIVLFPPFITLMIALWIPPEWISGLLEQLLWLIGLTIIPLTTLSVGMQFQLRIEPSLRAPLVSALLIKMLLLPLFAIAIGSFVEVEEQIRDVTIFMAALPPMVIAATLLVNQNLAPRLAVAILGFGTILSLLTIPIWSLILN